MSLDKRLKNKSQQYIKAFKEKREGKYVTEPHHFTKRHAGVINRVRVDNKRFHNYYKEFNYLDKGVLNYLKWKKTVVTIFEVLKDNLIESTSGVYMEKLGYFTILKYPDIPELVYRLEGTLKMYDGGVLYTPAYFPLRKGDQLDMYTFNNNFSRSVTNEIYNKVYMDHKYKCAYTLVNGFAKNRRYEKI